MPRLSRAALGRRGLRLSMEPWAWPSSQQGRLRILLGLTIADGGIAAIDAIADPEHVAQLDVQILTD